MTLEPLLQRVAGKHESIKGEECWSLLYEAQGDLWKAIFHRKHEIRLIKKLRKLQPKVADYGPDELVDRLVLLGILYAELNEMRRAARQLREAAALSARKRIRFDSRDLLKAYEAEVRGPKRQGARLTKVKVQCRYRTKQFNR